MQQGETALAGQDIVGLPPIADRTRRGRANWEFRFFCESYFPHLFTLDWSADHLRVAALALLANIKSHLAGNELLASDYPEAVHPIRRLEGPGQRTAIIVPCRASAPTRAARTRMAAWTPAPSSQRIHPETLE